MINQYIIKQLYKKIPSKRQNEYFLKIKRRASKKFGLPNPTNIEILKTYRQMIKSKKIKPSENIENLLITKNIRTLSGVAVVAVLTKPYACPGTCVYCPTEKDMPKSYLSNEPAVMRAILTDFHPYKQVTARIKSLKATGHKTDKIELIVMGGTFSYFPKQYQTWFIKECFQACNVCNVGAGRDLPLQYLQKTNEKSKHRIIGLTLETRPDYIDKKEIVRMRKLGATRVELGAQSIYDDVLKLNKRGHSVAEIIKATRLLKEAGFKINYHMMPNLPGSNYQRDLEMFKELFSNPDFQPDMLKIYPCVVVKNSPIYKWWKNGKYKPYSDEKLVELLAKIKKIIPYYVRITRLIRDIPSTSIVAGNKVSNLRQILKKKSEEENWRCKCIRCREVRDKFIPFLTPPARGKIVPLTPFKKERIIPPFLGEVRQDTLKLFRQDYNASNGKEIFLSFEDEKRKNLYSLLRLRINRTNYLKTGIQDLSCKNFANKTILPILQNAAIIREVHTYGQMLPIKSKNKKSPQHIGLGKKLILEAEKIASREFGLKKIAVISGVGVRNYYRKLGYKLKDGYMVKNKKV